MSRVLERTVDFLANRVDRRGFLGKSAVVGSAVVAAPLDFGLKPRTAYAAVCNCNGSSCNCGSLCCDGYTEFCCTLTGANACPPGTMTAGWWKVDGSAFCGGAARYYLDCNAQCGSCGCGANGVCSGTCSGTRCGCAKGSCGNRKAGCTRFRYGQCNQHVRCVGPIVCRVVTCKPPWQFDPNCGTSSRTDNATRSHDRACLNEPFGHVDSFTDTRSSSVRVRGWAIDNLDYGQSTIRVYVDNRPRVDVVANGRRPDVWAAYPPAGPDHGFDVTVPAAPGQRMICVYAIDRTNGRRTLLGFKEVKVSGPRFSIDRIVDLGAGRIRVDGWATDNTALGSRATVIFRVDDKEVRRLTTSVPRPDVAQAVPGSNLQSGFSVELTTGGGTHRVCVNLLSSQGRSIQLACRQVRVGPAPFGRVDAVTALGGGRVRVRGWVIDPTTTSPSQVRFRIDDVVVHTATANLSRPDVGAAHPGYGSNHGFDVTLDADVGPAVVCVDTVHPNTVAQLGCRAVEVTP